MSKLEDVADFASRHRRLLGALQLVILLIFFSALGWWLRGSFNSAANDLHHSNLAVFIAGCAVLGVYYLVFVFGWMWILREWGVRLSYPAALRAEMVSMLAKYIPGGIWTPAARVVAARRAGVTDAALVTSSMLLEAGLSAVAGALVFVRSLAYVDDVKAPLAPLIIFGVVIAILVQPRVFRPLAHKVLRRLGYKQELPNMRARTLSALLVFYACTWVVGGTALWLMLRSVGAHPEAASIVFLGGVSAVGARGARGLDVWADARGRDAGPGSRCSRPESARADGGRAAAAPRRRSLPAEVAPRSRPGRSTPLVSLAAGARHPARAVECVLVRVRDDVGSHLGAHPGLRPLGRRAGGRVEAGDAQAPSRRLAPDAGGRNGAWRSVLELFVCLGGARPLTLPPGRELHRRDGVPDRLDQPRDRARNHHGGAPRLGVRGRRVRGRAAHDRLRGAALPLLPQAPNGGRGAHGGGAWAARLDGRPCRNGHVRRRRRAVVAAAAHSGRLHGDGGLLRHGLGRGGAGRLRRAADRRRPRRLGAELVLAGALSRASPHPRQGLGAGDRPGRRHAQLRLLDRERAARCRPLERRDQLRRGARLHLRRPPDPPDPR